MTESSSALRRVIYVSRARPAGMDQQAMLDDILGAARRNNAKAGVTGALLYSARHFAQVLEGPPEAVDDIFETIQCDARHDDIAVLEVSAPSQRAFAAWSMAYVEAPEMAAGEFLTPDAADRLMGILQTALRNTDAAAA